MIFKKFYTFRFLFKMNQELINWKIWRNIKFSLKYESFSKIFWNMNFFSLSHCILHVLKCECTLYIHSLTNCLKHDYKWDIFLAWQNGQFLYSLFYNFNYTLQRIVEGTYKESICVRTNLYVWNFSYRIIMYFWMCWWVSFVCNPVQTCSRCHCRSHTQCRNLNYKC